jgi:hypothetical protein
MKPDRCHPWKGRRGPVRCSCRHGRMMTAHDLAIQIWWDTAEAITSLYETELAEYRRNNPMPNLADFMPGAF